MEFRVLGPLEVLRDGEVVPINAPMKRRILSLLLVHAGEVLSTERIIESLWPDEKPGDPLGALRVHITELRRVLGADPSPVVTEPPGYVLRTAPDTIDAARFAETVRSIRPWYHREPDRAAVQLEAAQALWRGRPYAEFEFEEFATTTVRELELLRNDARVMGFEIELDRGHHREALPGIELAVAESPRSEQIVWLYMLALYRDGRQADALAAFDEFEKHMVGAGLLASDEIRQRAVQIATHDPELDLTPPLVGNLPSPVSSFVGREAELSELQQVVERARVITLAGFGGIGKTRLAIELGDRVRPFYRDGVWFVDLSRGTVDEHVARHVARDLAIVESSGRSSIRGVIDEFRDKRAVIVLDNCEHVRLGAAETIEAIVEHCPDVHVVATSRERLGVVGEMVWEVPALPVPSQVPDDSPVEAAGCRLLIDRVRNFVADFRVESGNRESVVAVCELLEGVPLAIELAAARLRLVTPQHLLGELSNRFGALVDRRKIGPTRHHTLWDALEWSYDLLGPDDQELLRAVGTFRGGFDAGALAAVVFDADAEVIDGVGRLVDASLVRSKPDEQRSRYEVLETIREYAVEKQSPEELAGWTAKHMAFFAGLVEEQAPLLSSAEQAPALHRLLVDHDNLRSAIRAARAAGDGDIELRLVSGLARFWFNSGLHKEGREMLEETVSSPGVPPSAELAKAVEELVQLYAWSGQIADAEAFMRQQAEVARRVDDSEVTARVEASRALLGFITGDYRSAQAAWEFLVSHFRDRPDKALPLAHSYVDLAYLHLWMGERDEAWARLASAVQIAEDAGLDEAAAMEKDFRGWAAFQNGDIDLALDEWAAGEEEYRSLGLAPMQADLAQLQAWAMLIDGRPGAVDALETATEALDQLQLAPFVARGRMLLAAAEMTVDPESAGRRLAEALETAARAGARVWVFWCLWYGSQLLAEREETKAAVALRTWAEVLRLAIPLQLPAMFARRDERLATDLGVDRWRTAGDEADMDVGALAELLRG